mgnify:CR=1 FL=1|tara:strand:- start:1540 stop:2409 length:870 start_codon:yes stop_codon:yes gene_type:complete
MRKYWSVPKTESGRYSGLHEAFYWELQNIVNQRNTVKSRGTNQKEVLFRSFIIDDPTNLGIWWPSRKFNETYTLAEFLWYLSRNPNATNIGKFARIWLNIKDNEDNVESNYGCYVFGNQWNWSVNELTKDKDSRRATFVIGQPYHKTKNPNDIPCTQYLQFFIRNNKLHMGVSMRSNDIIFGMSNDIFIFCLFQQLMYNELKQVYSDLELGSYYHHAGSLHLYEMHNEMANNILVIDGEDTEYYGKHYKLKEHITLDYIQQTKMYLPTKDMTKEEIGEYANDISKSLFI